MEILTLIASASNVYDIVGELTEYTRDISPDTARQAVKAVGRIALSVSMQNCDWYRLPTALKQQLSDLVIKHRLHTVDCNIRNHHILCCVQLVTGL
jgi:hypothetical protein